MFGESLEKDIAETSIDATNEEAELPRPVTNDSESSVANGVPNSIESMTTPTDRWSLMDDILQVYKEHTQDMKQVKRVWSLSMGCGMVIIKWVRSLLRGVVIYDACV